MEERIGNLFFLLKQYLRNMQELMIEMGQRTPEIRFSPAENVFYIRGISSPEDVRKIYYPVIEWFDKYMQEAKADNNMPFNEEEPLRFQFDLTYFNSSSAKFFYEILSELKKLTSVGIPVLVEWYYERDDTDMKEAGFDLASLAGLEFVLIQKQG